MRERGVDDSLKMDEDISKASFELLKLRDLSALWRDGGAVLICGIEFSFEFSLADDRIGL
jgi:hypothetical protein